MNSYFNKAVFYTEKKNRNSSMLAFSLIYFFELYNTIIQLYAAKNDKAFVPPTPTYVFGNAGFLFICIALTSIVYSYLEKDKKYYFMLTQPYSRDSIIITKTVSFIASYTIPTIVYGIVSYIIVALNKKYYYFYNQYIGDYYSVVIPKLFLGVLCIIAVLTFLVALLQFFQMCFGKCIAGVVLPFIMLMILSLTSNIMSYFISRKLGPLRDLWQDFTNLMFKSMVIVDGVPQYKSLAQLTWDYLLNFNLYVSLVLLLISAVLFYLSVLLNRKIKAENTSNIFLFKFTEASFKAVFSLFTSIILSLMLGAILYYLISKILGQNFYTYLMFKYGISGKENIEHSLYLVLDILWIPLTILVYKLFSKIMDKRRVF